MQVPGYLLPGQNPWAIANGFSHKMVCKFVLTYFVISQNDVHFLTTTLKVNHSKSQVMPNSHFHVLLLSSVIGLIYKITTILSAF